MAGSQRDTSPKPTSTVAGLRLVEKAVEVLDLLAVEGELTVAQLADRTGEPRSSLYRLIGSLEKLDFVEPGSLRGAFRLGVHVLRLGAATFSGLDERSRAIPVMTRIRDETGLTAYLLVRRGRQAICVERLEGLRVASLALQVGGSLPLHAGAAPRALLAFGPEEAWQEYADGSELQLFTTKTPDSAKRLVEVLAKERRLGVTVSDGDVTNGIAAVGAPIYDHHGQVKAAISVSGLREEVIGRSAPDVRRLIAAAAAEISSALGYEA